MLFGATNKDIHISTMSESENVPTLLDSQPLLSCGPSLPLKRIPSSFNLMLAILFVLLLLVQVLGLLPSLCYDHPFLFPFTYAFHAYFT